MLIFVRLIFETLLQIPDRPTSFCLLADLSHTYSSSVAASGFCWGRLSFGFFFLLFPLREGLAGSELCFCGPCRKRGENGGRGCSRERGCSWGRGGRPPGTMLRDSGGGKRGRHHSTLWLLLLVLKLLLLLDSLVIATPSIGKAKVLLAVGRVWEVFIEFLNLVTSKLFIQFFHLQTRKKKKDDFVPYSRGYNMLHVSVVVNSAEMWKPRMP